MAWNVVTSYSTSSAKANGLDTITPHDKRYEKAHEYMDLCYRYDSAHCHVSFPTY